MARNKLREVFSNEADAAIVKEFEAIRKIACEKKLCCTCEYYIPVNPYLPGFVSDFPECKCGKLDLNTCEKYKEMGDGYEQK